MPSLKDYRDRIASVKSTRKITSAMKMVAASKLKKAQENAEASQPYAQTMAKIMARVAGNVNLGGNMPKLLSGTGRDDVYLLVIMTSDRGLCAGFNSNLVRFAKRQINDLRNQGKTVKIITVGRKARDMMRMGYGNLVIHHESIASGPQLSFDDANKISARVLDLFEKGEFDVCRIYYNTFQSILVQKPTEQQIIPFSLPESKADNDNEVGDDVGAPYDFEPEQEKILEALLPRNIGVQIFQALLDSAAGEQAARMTAMDNATRNAGDMINKVTLQYNRARQAYITKELIEIISGAEAV